MLIDEAQDLPPEFFRLVYLFTKGPKRIVWAYDELQKLSESAMPSTEELFGTSPSGDSLVSLTDSPREARRDIILPICYRNSPWALATAHGIGFGIYRNGGLVQHFDNPDLWTDIGYEVTSGRLQRGRRVRLRRSSRSYPSYFDDLLTPTDAVSRRAFDDETAQDEWVARHIRRNLDEDELEADDILIVLPDAYTARRRAPRLAERLFRHRISSHLVGVQSSVDEVFISGSVAIAHIHRAKGNEAPMVYVLDAHYAVRPVNAVTRRNTLFTAITRSRAWVRICGWGDEMTLLDAELSQIQTKNFELEFKVPNAEELKRLRRVHRERTEEEAALVERTTAALADFVTALEEDALGIEDLPPSLRTRLINELQRKLRNDPES